MDAGIVMMGVVYMGKVQIWAHNVVLVSCCLEYKCTTQLYVC